MGANVAGSPIPNEPKRYLSGLNQDERKIASSSEIKDSL
jgi:hypothetical protein